MLFIYMQVGLYMYLQGGQSLGENDSTVKLYFLHSIDFTMLHFK